MDKERNDIMKDYFVQYYAGNFENVAQIRCQEINDIQRIEERLQKELHQNVYVSYWYECN